MLIFRKISSTLYGISVFAFIAFIITYFSGLGISDLISAVIILMYLIGIKFDLLADLLESRKPFSKRIGKTILALDWFLSALLLFSGLFYLFFSDVTFGAPNYWRNHSNHPLSQNLKAKQTTQAKNLSNMKGSKLYGNKGNPTIRS